MLADAPEGDAWEAFWLVGGRVSGGVAVADLDEMVRLTDAALRAAGRPLTPGDVAAARTAETWIAANEPYVLELAGGVARERLAGFLGVCGVAVAA